MNARRWVPLPALAFARHVPLTVLSVSLGALLVAMVAMVAMAAPGWADDQKPRILLTVQDPRITESSGLVASARHEGVLYTHNDSDDGPRVYAIGPDGQTRATLTLQGVSARDWEAMAPGRDEDGRPVLYLGDIGDNRGTWETVSVYRAAEPRRLRDTSLPATRYRLRYEDGPRDAEALLVHPRTGRLYVVSKEFDAGLYAAPEELHTERVNVLRRVAEAPPIVTDGAYAPDGSSFALRGYGFAYLFREPGARSETVDLPIQPQGESLAFTRDGSALLAGSEGTESNVWEVPLPEDFRPEPNDGQTGNPDAGNPSQDPAGWPLWQVGLVAGALTLLALTVSRRRRQ